jgi:hypothetical protein
MAIENNNNVNLWGEGDTISSINRLSFVNTLSIYCANPTPSFIPFSYSRIEVESKPLPRTNAIADVNFL